LPQSGVCPSNKLLHDRPVPAASTEVAIDTDKQLIVVRFAKKVTAGDIARYVGRLLADPSFRPGFSEIVDLTEVEELDLQADEYLKLADEVDPFSENAKRAFVVKTSVPHHAARMHKALRSQQSIAIFSSMEDAMRWVGGSSIPL